MDLSQLFTSLESLEVQKTKVIPDIFSKRVSEQLDFRELSGFTTFGSKSTYLSNTLPVLGDSKTENIKQLSKILTDLPLLYWTSRDAVLNPKMSEKKDVATQLNKVIPKLTPYSGGFDDFI